MPHFLRLPFSFRPFALFLLAGILLFSCGETEPEKKGRNNPHPPFNRRAAKLMDSAEYFMKQGINQKQSEKFLEDAISIHIADSNAYGEALASYRLSILYSDHDKDRAFRLLDRAFRITADKGYDSLMVELYLFRGAEFSTVEQQVNDYLRADSLARLNKMEEMRIRIFQEKGSTCFFYADPFQYRDCADSAITVMLKLGRKKEAAIALENLAEYAENEMHNINVAADKLEQSAGLFREVNDSFYLAKTLSRLGFLQGGQRVYGGAWKNLREGIRIYELKGLKKSAAEARMDLALVYEKSNQPDSALVQLSRAAETWMKADDPDKALECLNNGLRICTAFSKIEAGKQIQSEADELEGTSKNIRWEQRLNFYRKSARFFSMADDSKQVVIFGKAAQEFAASLQAQGISIPPDGE
ncbi:MAG: hypothetical protein FD123_1870 [Bacteroidetes bacterium]|nr:MAG: hypothetical protein FD123_1870 [Bacteroidota bacterium]